MTLDPEPTASEKMYSVILNQVAIEWQLDRGKLSFFGIPAALFWLNPSLLNMLRPLADEVGTPLFRLLIAYQSSLGTDEDYHAMVTVLGPTFPEGFLAWGRAVSGAGWGSFELPVCDLDAKRAVVIVRNPWELQMQEGVSTPWGCPFIQGKLIGVFAHAFGVPCWADERTLEDTETGSAIEFQIYETTTTISAELERLRHNRQLARDQELERMIDQKTRELQELSAQLEERVAARTAELNNAYQTVKSLNSQLQRELALARRIQESLLPPPPTSWQEIEVLGYTAPAREVGGDLYAYHMLEPGRFVVAVGDISGKGMPAALLMAVSTAILRSLVVQRHSPGVLLDLMNSSLRAYTSTTRQNCALVCAEICREGESFMLRIANAGGISPLIRRRDGSIQWLEVGGLPLGGELVNPQGYAELNLDLFPGDQVLLISDGVVEAMDGRGDLYGFDRLEETVRLAPQGDISALKAHIQADLDAFVGTIEPHDDMTMVVIQVR